jgi:hypothetical protein
MKLGAIISLLPVIHMSEQVPKHDKQSTEPKY